MREIMWRIRNETLDAANLDLKSRKGLCKVSSCPSCNFFACRMHTKDFPTSISGVSKLSKKTSVPSIKRQPWIILYSVNSDTASFILHRKLAVYKKPHPVNKRWIKKFQTTHEETGQANPCRAEDQWKPAQTTKSTVLYKKGNSRTVAITTVVSGSVFEKAYQEVLLFLRQQSRWTRTKINRYLFLCTVFHWAAKTEIGFWSRNL